MTLPLNPAAILIDLDGTLADSLGVMRTAYEEFLKSFAKVASEKEFQQLNGPPLKKVVRCLKIAHNLAEQEEMLLHQYYTILDRLYQKVQPMPGAFELLHQAKIHHCLVAIVTSNSYARTKAWLDITQLHSFIDFIIAGDTLTFGKPHPEPYLQAIAKASCDIPAMIAVEDTIQGTLSALAAGLKTYMLCASHTTIANGVTPIASLHHLNTLLWNG